MGSMAHTVAVAMVSVGRTVGPIQACPNSPEPVSEMSLEVTGVSERFRVLGLGVLGLWVLGL